MHISQLPGIRASLDELGVCGAMKSVNRLGATKATVGVL